MHEKAASTFASCEQGRERLNRINLTEYRSIVVPTTLFRVYLRNNS